MKILKISVKVELTKSGYSAFALNYPVYTTGRTIEELKTNMLDALNFYLEDEGIVIHAESIDFQYELDQFFKHYRVLNTKFLAERIGINPTLFSQYVNGWKKPSAKQKSKIVSGLHSIGSELSQLKFD